jgi:hypothetical protein
MRFAVVAAVLAVTPLVGRAQPLGWGPPASGPAYTASYATTATAACLNPEYLGAGMSCTASGNAITLGNNGAFLTLTFAGLTQNITATNELTPVTLGSIAQSFSGVGPFEFPRPRPGLNPFFGFSVRVAETAPAAGSSAFFLGYQLPQSPQQSLPHLFLFGTSGFAAFPVTPPPPPFRYTNVVLGGFGDMTLRTDGTPVVISARVSLVPEPSTFALAGIGACGVALATRRRKRG